MCLSKTPRKAGRFALRTHFDTLAPMEHLGKLFGSEARLKLLRLFFFNDDSVFTSADAASRAKVSVAVARREISVLESSRILKRKAGGKATLFMTDKNFPYHESLGVFLRSTTMVKDANILNTLKRAGTIKLVVLSGLFTGTLETKIDILVVGDHLEERPLATAIQKLEAEMGRELRYASFATSDFRYRQGVYDRLIRDVFDYPRRKILDKIGV